LGECYEYGYGIEKNDVKAFEYYKKSAKQEYSYAQNKLGFFYESGIGIEKNLENAFYWFQKVAEKGN